jgi:ABC-type nitrate/sulfonate/bicarbonate transport system substrate-binding protein
MIHFQATRRFTIFVLTAITFLALTITGCQPQKPADLPQKVTIDHSTAGNAILMNLAFAQDYFREEGLDAKHQTHAFGKPALQSVIDGKADLATTADTPIRLAVIGGDEISKIQMWLPVL